MANVRADSELEQWREIPSWPGYEASSTGHIRRTGGDVVPVSFDQNGYPRVYLRSGGRRDTPHVHVLVLEAFHGPRPGHPRKVHGCHNDGDPLNSRADNLRWDSAKANSADRKLHGTDTYHWHAGMSHNVGAEHPRAKFTDDDIRAIRESKAPGVVLAERYQATKGAISLIRSRKRWGHVT